MNPPEPQPEANANTPSDSKPQIAKRAYELYEERQGDPATQDWEHAEQDVRKDEAEHQPETKVEPKPETKSEAKPEAKATPTPFIKKKGVIVGGIVLAVLAAVACGFLLERLGEGSKKNRDQLILYGNVDLRQVELSFNNSERIAEVLVQEGDKVTRGQVVALLDTSRLRPQVAEAKAEMEAQRSDVQKLHNGSRPEEIAQARANVASAQADRVNAEQQWTRLTELSVLTTGKAISQQDLDSAKAAVDMAQARLEVSEKALELSILGPRKEDIAQGEAQLSATRAQLDLLRHKLADAALISPSNAVVRSRLMEAGEMASPQKPVYDLAITDPKWIRAYVSEADLGKIHAGMKASISADSFPDRVFSGWIGFISSVAEFTPKTVQTTELRSSLVYEIRVFVQDPQDEMRLGTPATVTLELDPPVQGRP